MPELKIEFFAFANINNTIRLRNGKLLVRLSDLLEGAPETVLRAIAHILLAKMYRRPIDRGQAARYRKYVASHEIVRKAHLVRQMRGRKRLRSARGHFYDLDAVFEDLNTRFFHGLMARPRMSWSQTKTRRILGQHQSKKMLMSEARIHSHDQHLIEVWEYFFQNRRRGSGVNCHSSAFSKSLNTLHRAVAIVVTFPMNEK